MDIKPDGTFRLDMRYFNYATGLTMTNRRFDAIVRRSTSRARGGADSARDGHCGVDPSRHRRTIVLKLAADDSHRELEVDHLCLAGGVALNCVANGRLEREGPFKQISGYNRQRAMRVAPWARRLRRGMSTSTNPEQPTVAADTMQRRLPWEIIQPGRRIDEYLTGIDASFQRYDDTHADARDCRCPWIAARLWSVV